VVATILVVAMSLAPRMIQNFTGESNLEYHWGYAYRVVPCKNDAGSCEYLDVVYAAHDTGMVYTAIFWASFLGLVLLLALLRRLFTFQPPTSTLTRLCRALASSTRRYLLPNGPHSLFGHTTRLQITILAVLAGYLTIFSFAGITYGKWLTPIANQPPSVYNTRTSLGPWADRVGVLAYALTPLSILLASRESIFSLATGIPYTSFLFLHRWTGHLILLQSALHTLGWLLVETKLYQPQPLVWETFMKNTYAIWGFVALALLVLLWVLALPWTIRHVTGYEAFRKIHYVLAMVYIGAAIGHWEELQCFLVPGLVLWAVDRLARLLRTAVIHYGYLDSQDGNGKWGFKALDTQRAIVFPDEKYGDVMRLDIAHRRGAWQAGQHFYLCFVEGSIWQSHPFTPLSLPVPQLDAKGKSEVVHSYVFRAKGGETKKVANLLQGKIARGKELATKVILQGPYGESIMDGLDRNTNVLCVAGGTGITYVLPVLLKLVSEPVVERRKLELVWAVKRDEDVEWIRPELDKLHQNGVRHGIKIRIFVTDGTADTKTAGEKGEKQTAEVNTARSSNSTESEREEERRGRPNVEVAVSGFVDDVAKGSTRVYGSGPAGMIGDLRAAVAKNNSGAKVWKGEERFDVRLVCDERMEW